MKLGYLLTLVITVLSLSFPCFADESKPHIDPPYNYEPPKGVILDEPTAIAVAEAILKPIYGADKIKQEEPFGAVLKEDVWTVTGDFHQTKTYPPKLGGVAEIKISKSKGCVINITHGM
jgi:hypothetical protein